MEGYRKTMDQSLAHRMNYHPDVRESSIKSYRKVKERFDLIKSRVDFKNKVVWDLGCSGGFFSLSLASQVKKVIAVDGDLAIIEKNKAIQHELGIKNIEFIHANIDSELIDGLEPADVTIFLSVFHHILTTSTEYAWNKEATMSSASHLIDSINARSNTLIFEIGYPNEGCPWCEDLPNYGDDWDEYVINHIFRDCYRSVEKLNPEIKLNWYKKAILSKLSKPYQRDSLFVQRIKSLFQFDPRDYRKIYFGFK